ncbi:MAG: hypothetical protein ACLR3C_17680 [Eggerthella lenta]
MSDRATINAQGIEVTFYKGDAYADHVSLTDIARYKSPTPKDVIKNWMRTHDVIEYLGLWETLYNPSFKGVEFTPKARSGSNLNRAAREQLSLLLRSSAADGLEGGELGSGRALPSAS